MPDKPVHARQSQPRHAWAVLALRVCPFVLVLLTLGLAGCGATKVRHAQGMRAGPVVVLGDSLSAGYEMPQGAGFIELLAQRTGVPIENLGEKGATTTDSLPRVKTEVLPRKPALVIIQLGGNDALQRIDPKLTEENLSKMITQVQTEGVPVMLLGVRGGLMSDKYAAMFAELARRYETAYVPDLLDGILTRPELKHDNVHPNAKGHQALADKVEPELRRVLRAIGKIEGS